jgi:voltage-gated potassium channel
VTVQRPIPRSGPPDVLRPPPDATHARRRAYEVVFGHESSLGRIFDVVLIGVILLSVAAVLIESIPRYRAEWGSELRLLEWMFTGVFTVEYAVRLWCVGKPARYARSFFGLVDLAAILPSYLSLLLPGGQVLAVVRILRVLRVFRILKLAHYVGEANLLGRALRASRYKITVFLFTVVTVVVVVGSVMYLIEGPDHGFTSIPVGMYWAVVTLTTVGFGDITPQTGWGQLLASALMIMGYGIIAVPTGIVTAEITLAARSSGPNSIGQSVCPKCRLDDHLPDAAHCRHCGAELVREVARD